MTIRLAALAAAALAVLATPGCSGRTTDPASSVKVSRSPAESVDIAAAVRLWWQRAASTPKAQYFDPRLCGLKQSYTIWLLGGGASNGRQPRSCEVPAHHPILAPVINELLPAVPDASNRPLVRSQMSVKLDGRSLTPTEVTNNKPYAISAVPGNPIGLRAGDRNATDRGYWVLLDHGLAPGRHRLTAASTTGSRSWLLDAW